MATAKRTSVTLRNYRRGQALGNRPKPLLSLSLLLTILAIPDLLTGGGIATAATATVPSGRSCPGSTKFLFPTKGFDHFFFRDILNVTYDSLLVLPLLTVWCGQKVDQAEQKFQRDAVGSLSGSALVELNFSSNAPCWFELTSQDHNCADKSSNFVISPSQRSVNGATQTTPVIIGAPTSTSITSSTATASRSQSHLEAETESSTAARTTLVQEAPRGGGNDLSPGAKAAVGFGIGLFCVAIAAMSAFLFLRRRKQRGHDTDLARSIIDHDQRCGRTGPELKNGRVSSSLSSQRTDRTDESALYPIQPVFDGFPGSMGYEDERPLHSMTSNHSPISGPHSPTHSYNGGYWTQDRSIEREELAAARLKSKSHTAIPTVISYGPNPVTPTLTPRPNSRVAVTAYPSKGSPDSMEEIPDVPGVPVMPITVKDYPDYNNYSIPPPAPPPVHAKAPSPPRKAAVPIVVSYGPNRVTPTPLVASPTVPPDDTAIDRRFQELPGTNSFPVHHHERQFSWEADSPLLGHSHMGPLPPYASTADFEAMEKGAVRKLAEPQAQAELPPTKDGFYHYTSDIVEYELPGAAPQNEPQLPFRQYKPHHNQGPGVSSSGNVNGYADIDEQKFLLSDLLSDVEIARMREQKAVQKAKRLQEEKEARERGEEYDLGETMGASRARMNSSNNNNPNDGTTNASR